MALFMAMRRNTPPAVWFNSALRWSARSEIPRSTRVRAGSVSSNTAASTPPVSVSDRAAIATTPAVSLPYYVVFRVGHWLTLDAQLSSHVGAESCLQLDNPLLQLPPSLLKLFAP